MVISLGFAACDSGPNSPDTDASALPGFMAGAGGDNKVAVCHVGTEGPAYDPACNPDEQTCGDAGKVDLLFLPASIAAKHLEQGHDGQLVDYDPFTAGATGEGQEDTSDDGKYVDDGCVIPGEPEEIIYAVAYIDVVDNGEGYDPDTDHLIAKLVEASGDGTLGNGDMVVTDVYPTSFEPPWQIADFNITEHKITYCDNITANEINCIYESYTRNAQFIFKHGEAESYTEGDYDSSINYSLIQDRMTPASTERIWMRDGSPSNPSVPIDLNRDELTGDDPFLDVEIRQQD